jgi:hypothetical protein
MGFNALGVHARGVCMRCHCCASRGADCNEGTKALIDGHRNPKDERDGQ